MVTKEYRLKQLTEKITKGTTPSNIGESFTEEGIMYFRSELIGKSKYIDKSDGLLFISNETHEKLKRSQIQKNDLLFSMAGIYLGKISLVGDEDFPANTNQAVAIIRFNSKEIDLEYVYYYMTQRWYNIYINSLTAQAAQPNINLEQIGNLKLNLPPLPTQQKIASILSAYDNLIQNYKKQIEALQTAASELYKEWFVRFRFPGYQTTKFENGIPEGWKLERLSNYCKITDGTHDTPLQVEEGIPLVTGKAVKKGEIDFSIPYNISIEDHEKIKKRSGLKTGDILFSNIGTVGNSCLVEYDREFSVKNMIIFKPETIEKSMYLYYLITSDSCQQLFSAQTNGSTQQFLGLDFMRNFKILVPENLIISEFGKQQEVIYAKIRNLRKQITNLTQQRDLLLPRLMSGKLEV